MNDIDLPEISRRNLEVVDGEHSVESRIQNIHRGSDNLYGGRSISIHDEESINHAEQEMECERKAKEEEEKPYEIIHEDEVNENEARSLAAVELSDHDNSKNSPIRPLPHRPECEK